MRSSTRNNNEAPRLDQLLAEGGKANSLGRVNDVIDIVLTDKNRLSELYDCLFHDDAWVRMRAADAFEKICRVHPEWIKPYINRIQTDLSDTEQQASIKWHIAQIYPQVRLSDKQQKVALEWLANQLLSADVDWIVAASCMKALNFFVVKGAFSRSVFKRLLEIQKNNPSKTVAKKASQISDQLA